MSGTCESFSPCVLGSTAVSPQSSWSKKAIPSRTARGNLSNGVNKCQGASCNEGFDDKELRGALDGDRYLELRECVVSWNIVNPPSKTIYLQCAMLILGVVVG